MAQRWQLGEMVLGQTATAKLSRTSRSTVLRIFIAVLVFGGLIFAAALFSFQIEKLSIVWAGAMVVFLLMTYGMVIFDAVRTDEDLRVNALQ